MTLREPLEVASQDSLLWLVGFLRVLSGKSAPDRDI